MKRVILILALTAFGITSSAQQPPIASTAHRFAWDQPAPTLIAAQGYTYKYYLDGSSTGVAFANVTCSGTTSPFTCSVPVPAFTQGNHTIEFTAGNIAGESAKSSPFAFSFVGIPSSPSNIRLISPGA